MGTKEDDVHNIIGAGHVVKKAKKPDVFDPRPGIGKNDPFDEGLEDGDDDIVDGPGSCDA